MALPAAAFPLRVSGADILGADGRPVRLAGVNWGGAYADHCVPAGLDRLHRSEIIARIISWGMNHVRLPFALGAIAANSGALKTAPADPARLAANPDLAGLTPWQVYQALVDGMTAAGLYVILNQHLLYPGWCCSGSDVNGLWYNDNWPSSTFTDTWVTVAQRFAANPAVGFDLHNEPRPAVIAGQVRTPTWGDGAGGTDIRQMYQATTGRIRAAVTNAGSGIKHLVFCEGLAYAGDLTGWAAHPVTGENIVASAHDYPWYHRHADGTPQDWAGYSAQNERKWGYLETQGTAPVWIGECGSYTDAGRADFNHGWFPNFLRWAQEHGSHWCWWALQATEQQGTEPGTGTVKVKDGQREGYGLMAGQDWRGTQADTLAFLAPILA